MALLQPDRYFDRLSSIDIKRDIVACGFSYILLDVDNTLRNRVDGCIPRDVRRWVARVRDANIQIVLLSNSWHEITNEYGRELDLPVVMRALKPMPLGVARAFRVLNENESEPSRETKRECGRMYEREPRREYARGREREKATRKNTLIVGDQVFTDVLCAHLCGMTSYLVAPLSSVNIKSAAWQRVLEGRILQGQVPEGAQASLEDACTSKNLEVKLDD